MIDAPDELLTADLVGPEIALRGSDESTVWLQRLYDGDEGTTVLSGVGDAASAARLRFAEPVLTSGVQLSVVNSSGTTNATVRIEALIDGAWSQVASFTLSRSYYSSATRRSYGSFADYVAFPSGAVATTELRVRSTQDLHLREFRAGHEGRAPITPTWTSPVGFVGATGDAVTLAATGRNAWATAPLHYALAPGETLPAGTSLSTDGALTVGPVPGDRHNVTVRVSEGPDGVYAERTFHLTPNVPTADLVGPEIALRGTDESTVWLQRLYDGNEGTTVLSGVGDGTSAARLRFAAPVLTSGVQLSVVNSSGTTNATVRIEALIDGAWSQVASFTLSRSYYSSATRRSYGSFADYVAFPSGAVATTELRVRSTQDLHLREFRAGHEGRAPITPTWTSPVGFVGATGDAVALAATGRNAWATAPLHYALAPSETLPAGTSLSTDGALTVGPVPGDRHDVTVRVSEGPDGVYAERTFHLTPNVPTADLVVPETALRGTDESTVWLQRLYDGNEGTTVLSGVGDAASAARLRFAEPVLTSGVRLAVVNSSGTTNATVRVDALIDGVWSQVASFNLSRSYYSSVTRRSYGSFAGYVAFPSGAVATTELRVRSTQDLHLREFRAGYEGQAPIGVP